MFCVVLGVPSCLGYSVWADFDIGGKQILDAFDFTTNSVMMPIVALLTCIFIGYVIKPKALIEEVEISGPFKAKKLFTVVIKYVAPVCIVAILVFSVAEAFGFITV